MKISKIYISCYKGDVHLTRICVASIRYWYPLIPITLLRDHSRGLFDTSEIERIWNVNIFDVERNYFGWGMSKLEPLLLSESNYCFVMDSDIVFCGPVLDLFKESRADFIVSGRSADTFRPGEIDALYINRSRIQELDPDFCMPDYYFNTGQFVAKTGIFQRNDFESLVSWDHKPVLKYPDVFSCADQGVLNYFLHKQHQIGRISLESIPFMVWPDTSTAKSFDFQRALRSGEDKIVLHWAGLVRPTLGKMLRNDILKYFESFYYSKIPNAGLKRRIRAPLAFLVNRRLHYITRLKMWGAKRLENMGYRKPNNTQASGEEPQNF